MKAYICLLTASLVTIPAIANDNMGLSPKYGTLQGRIQTLSMWRDYDQSEPKSAYSHSMGLQLDYTSPEFAGLQTVLSYSGVGVLDAQDIGAEDPGASRVLNGRVNVLNEAYLQYRFAALGAGNTKVAIGRQAQNGEVFRYVEARQKKRSLEGVFFHTGDIPKVMLSAGHAWRISNIYGTENARLGTEFDDIPVVLNADEENTDGISWIETTFKGIPNLELALYNAVAWDIANLFGSRIKASLTESTAIEASYRNETDSGNGTDHNADVYSLALICKLGDTQLEGGYFGVKGDSLLFEENTTGINHPLGYSLIIATSQFAGGADTAYLKAVTKVHKTTLYCLLNSTWHDKLPDIDNAQEINIVIKQPLTDSLTASLKGGIAQIQKESNPDEQRTDARVFLTYNF
jgi:hypothetical protein